MEDPDRQVLLSADKYQSLVRQLFPELELVAVQPLTGGVSTDVHRLDLKGPADQMQRLVLRAHRDDHSGHSAALEYQLLQALHLAGVPVPEPVLIDDSGKYFPAPFLLMSFVEGSTEIPAGQASERIEAMAAALAGIHRTPIQGLPTLPARLNPLPEVFDYLPTGIEWSVLHSSLRELQVSNFSEPPVLLHGDFWPENLLWRDGALAAVLDWEDAALGDRLSDVACCRLELRYKLGAKAMQQFSDAYAKHLPVDEFRLHLWQIYVAAAAQKFMGQWGLDAQLEAHMRREAVASIREAAVSLELM